MLIAHHKLPYSLTTLRLSYSRTGNNCQLITANSAFHLQLARQYMY